MNDIRQMYKAAPGLVVAVGSMLTISVLGLTSLLFL